MALPAFSKKIGKTINYARREIQEMNSFASNWNQIDPSKSKAKKGPLHVLPT